MKDLAEGLIWLIITTLLLAHARDSSTMDRAATKTGSPHWTSATRNVQVSKIRSLYKQHDENMDIYVWASSWESLSLGFSKKPRLKPVPLATETS